MGHFTIPRRTMLRGAGGVALALPALEIMRGPRAAAADTERPKRFVICHCGISIGAYFGWPDDGKDHSKERVPCDFVTPPNTGAKYEIGFGLQCIKDEGVQDDMGLVSGLHIPVAPYVEAGKTPPASFPPGGTGIFHGGTHVPQYAGKTMWSGEERDRAQNPCYASADQLVVDIISSRDQYMPTLPLTFEGYFVGAGKPGGGDATFLSFEPSTTEGKDPWGRPLARGMQPYFHPSAIYKQLFDPTATANVGPPGDPAAFEARKTYQLSVLDFVHKKTERLLKRLGKHDQLQMERWRDHIRTLEKQIGALQPLKRGVPDPGDYTAAKDPAPGDTDPLGLYPSGWGHETDRARMQSDLIHAAFMTDRTRVVSWLMTGYQSDLSLEPISGLAQGMHGASHIGGGFPDHMAKGVNFHIAPIARLVKNLQQTPDFDGSSRMIDNTIIVMFFEGGVGRNISLPEANEGFIPGPFVAGRGAGRYAHSTDEMVIIMAGGKNLGLQPGQHIHYPMDYNQHNNVTNVHPGQVIWQAIKQLGYTGPFGDLPARDLPEMLRAPA